MAEPVRVVLCDDHAMFRSGLRRILAEEEGLEVVGEAGTAEEAGQLVVEHRPDVLVLDLGLPDENGLVVISRVRQSVPPVQILVLTMENDLLYVRKALAAGAAGYLLKEAADVELVAAVRTLAAGRPYVDPSLGAALAGAAAEETAGPLAELSPRERETLRLIALGHTNQEISEALHVSIRTVESHRNHIHQKLGVRNRAQLVRLAQEAGLC